MHISPPQPSGLLREKPAQASQPAKASGPLPGRLLRAAFAIAVVGTTVFFIHDRFFVTASEIAVMAGRSLVLRSPIDGRIAMPPWSHGQNFASDSPVISIVNERADTQRLAELRNALATTEGEILAIEQRAAGTGGLFDAAMLSAEAFRRIRMDQLRPRIAEAEALLRSALAKQKEAETSAGRAETLQRQGYASTAALDVLRRDLSMARDAAQAAAERRAALLAEQQGAAAGIFATDNATDRSISQQTTDRLALSLVEVDWLLADRRARRLATLRHIEAEEQRLALQREAVLRAPRAMVLVQMLVQPGEFVRAGQELARFAGCGERLVRTEVDERTFRSLAVGQHAAFRPAGGPGGTTGRLPGEVVELVPTNLTPGLPRSRPQAIIQLAASEGTCETGRIGAVRFD